MRRPRIIYVPGKNKKPDPAEHRQQLWRCLLHGVSSIDADAGRKMAADPNMFILAAWNHFYYGEYSSLQKDLPWIDKLLQADHASPQDRVEARSWSKWAVKLMYALGDRFNQLIPLIPDARVKAMIEDTAPYFENRDDIACLVREIVKTPLRSSMLKDERVLLISHSMGSVIAYDALWELSQLENMHSKIELFLTMGSPLGMRYVQNHLLGFSGASKRYPYTIKKWKNISAIGDLVSVDTTISDDFFALIEAGAIEQTEDYCDDVYNWFRNDDGLNVHRSFGYLVNPLIGHIIADWWRDQEHERDSLRHSRRKKRTAPELVAHRGYPQRFPENTIPGYKASLAAGACHVECDVQLTADQVPVLYHDKDLERLSGAKGLINETSFQDLSELDARQPKRFGDQYAGTPIPTLQEFSVLLESRPQVTAFVELKRGSLARFGVPTVVDRVMQDLQTVSERVVLISFDHACLAYARRRHAIRIGWVLPAWSKRNEDQARALAPEFLFCEDKLLPEYRFSIWQGPWRWAVYVVNDPADAFSYSRLGMDLIETDAIGEMLSDPGLGQRACR